MTASRFRFNAPEWAGAFGDLGTLLPFAMGLIDLAASPPAGQKSSKAR